MGQNSKIEWTHHTGNLWWGCTKVHRGCDNCYAEHQSDNMKRGTKKGIKLWGNNQPRRIIKSVWTNFLSWQAKAEMAGEYHRVFVGSMMDIFEKPMQLVDHQGNPVEGNTGELRDWFFAEIIPACPNLIFLLLTKRPSNINRFIPKQWLTNPPENVWFGTSPVDQKTFDKLVPQLCKVNGNRFLSVEPQLEDIIFYKNLNFGIADKIGWIIQGGESGSNRRLFDLNWAKSLYKQCLITGIPYFFKQIDGKKAIPDNFLIRQIPVSFADRFKNS